ncbi:hypothetical protein I79_012667 [Cricetulus griseus]|uniref:Uncharacterized protein n=1 Tax=Cricetulus griseus TaxID=10029 RepID=G3HPF5_CRIGR|nr:hypothetical protein I79_012667 [Cricetulus griseus]
MWCCPGFESPLSLWWPAPPQPPGHFPRSQPCFLWVVSPTSASAPSSPCSHPLTLFPRTAQVH